MDQVVAAGSRWRIMKNRWSVYLYEFIGKKHVEHDLKKKKKKLSKREQTEQEHHKKRRTLFVSSPT